MAFSLNDYSEVHEIASGGMGKVYLATQRSLARKVVIKEMAIGLLTNDIAIKRFENEATAAASLNHDNIIRIYDFGEDHGAFYIAMEFIDGPDAESMLMKPDVPPEINLMVALQAFRGLNFAHRQNIIHRDVKPANFMVGKSGAVKVLDFGLAFAAARPLNLTRADAIIGTPLYMSPEQALGADNKDLRMDIWACGVLLFRILSGQHPFGGENVPSVIYNIVHTPIPSVATLVPTLPDEIVSVVNSSLEKNPEKRLTSLGPIIDVLQNYFYEIGIRDTSEEVSHFMSGRHTEGRRLLNLIGGYHLKKALMHETNGDMFHAGAHYRHTLRYDSTNETAVAKVQQLGIQPPTSLRLASLSGQGTGSRSGKTSHFRTRKDRLIITLSILIGIALISLIGVVGYWYSSNNYLSTQTENITINSQLPAVDSAQVGMSAVIDTVSIITPASAVESASISHPKPRAVVVSDATSRKGPLKKGSPKPQAAIRPVPSSKIQKSIASQLVETSSIYNQPISLPEFGTLKVTVTPSSAKLTLDNEPVLPFALSEGKKVSVGRHLLVAEAQGYSSISQAITIEPNAMQILSLSLNILEGGPGSLHIYSKPWANIYVDGSFVGTAPMAKPLSLKEGNHLVLLKQDGFKTYEEMAVIKAGETLRIKATLEKE